MSAYLAPPMLMMQGSIWIDDRPDELLDVAPGCAMHEKRFDQRRLIRMIHGADQLRV